MDATKDFLPDSHWPRAPRPLDGGRRRESAFGRPPEADEQTDSDPERDRAAQEPCQARRAMAPLRDRPEVISERGFGITNRRLLGGGKF